MSMYQVGDYVVYNEEGVCYVANVGKLSMPSADKNQQYYFLKPLSGDGKVYVPVDTTLPMRPVLNREQALALIQEIPGIVADINRFNNKRVLEEHYRAMMKPHTPEALVKTIKSVYEKRWGAGEKPKALNATDEYYKKRAEAMLYQELALALNIPVDQVERFICDSLDAAAGA
ncbi:MAG: CarD family transcriptional regulator [Clostridia bacterium]|nr:CarD family transcriptional regulator [Clostridia bacterium]